MHTTVTAKGGAFVSPAIARRLSIKLIATKEEDEGINIADTHYGFDDVHWVRRTDHQIHNNWEWHFADVFSDTKYENNIVMRLTYCAACGSIPSWSSIKRDVLLVICLIDALVCNECWRGSVWDSHVLMSDARRMFASSREVIWVENICKSSANFTDTTLISSLLPSYLWQILIRIWRGTGFRANSGN